MVAFPEPVWLLLAAVAAFGVVQALRALAMRIRNETAIHDFRVGIAELQIENLHHAMTKHGVWRKDGGLGEVEIVDEAPEDELRPAA